MDSMLASSLAVLFWSKGLRLWGRDCSTEFQGLAKGEGAIAGAGLNFGGGQMGSG